MKKIFLSLAFISALNAHTLEQVFDYVDSFGASAAASAKAKAAELMARASQASYLPVIDLNAGAVANSAGVDMTQPKYGAKAGLELNWLLFSQTRAAAIKSAQALSELAYSQAKEVKAAAKLAAAKAYYARLALFVAQDAASAQCDALKKASIDVAKLAASGLKELDEAQMLDAASARCIAHRAELDSQAAILDASLQALTGIKIIANGKEDDSENVDLKFLELYAKKERIRSDIFGDEMEHSTLIKRAQANVKLAQTKTSQAKASFIPQVFLRANSGYEYSKLRYENFGPLAPLIEKNGKKRAQANSVMLGMKINLFEGGAGLKRIQAAKLEELAASHELAAAKAQLQAKLEASAAQIKASETQLEAAILGKQAAQSAALSIEKKYHAGLTNYTEFVRALSASQKASAQYASALAALASAKAEQAYLLGDLND